MFRRLAGVCLLFLALNMTGCALLQLVMVPFKLLFSILGSAGSAVGVAEAGEIRGPAPIVREAGTGQWLVEGLRRDAPCRIVCSAPGYESRVYSWPGDFAEAVFVKQESRVSVLLKPSK